MMSTADPYTLLVVEDDPAHQMLVRQAVTDSDDGCSLIQVAGSIQEALRFLEQMEFDVLLVDNRLPDGWGLDLVAGLREAGSATPMVLMTNAGSEILAVQAWRLHLNNYVIKDRQFWRDVPLVLRGAVDHRRAALDIEEAHGSLERAHSKLQGLHRDIQLSNDELRQGSGSLETLEAAMEDLQVFSRAVSHGLSGPLDNLNKAMEALADGDNSAQTKKVKALVKKALAATTEIESTARRLKDLCEPGGKKKAPKADLDVLVTRVRERMERQSDG